MIKKRFSEADFRQITPQDGKPLKLSLGDSLYLIVSPSGAKRFQFRARFKGEKVDLSFKADSLKEARDRCTVYRAQIVEGQDPRDVRRAAKAEAAGEGTFRTVAEAVYDARRSEWRSEAHAKQWWDSIFNDCPRLLDMQVAAITTQGVLDTLQPLFERSFTAGKRTRERIALVLEAAREKGLVAHDRRNAADIKTLLPKKPDVEQKHHKGLDYREVPALFAKLRTLRSVSAQCLQFIYLTGSRSKEARGATWDEIEGLDGDAPVWLRPAERMKRGRAHRVPLSPQAVAILKDRRAKRTGQWVFPGQGKQGCIGNPALHVCLDRHHPDKDLTVHGSRNSFRDWLDEVRGSSIVRARQALSHKVGSDIDEAYLRSDALDARRADITAWGAYCTGEGYGKVVRLQTA